VSASDRPLLPGSAPLLVGRERELALLREHLDAAMRGHGSLVLIGGEAGIGKTALAEAVGQKADRHGALVLVGHCYDALATPYGPWLEVFSSYRCSDGGPSLPAPFATPGSVGEVTNQAALLRQVLDFFIALATQQPVVLLFEDLHWAEAGSLDVLRFVARAIAPLPLLLLATYRSDELAPTVPLYPLLPALMREAQAERLDLRPLDATAMRALVDMRYGLAPPDADRLVAYLRGRTEGHPLFACEMLRDVEETGVLHREGADWRLGDFGGVAVPPLLRQVIDIRVARLSDETQRLLRIASVAGQDVPYAVWAAVAEVDEDALLDAVAEAEAAHIVAENRDGTGAAFTHALVREAIYAQVRPSQRRHWHRAVGATLAATPHADADAVAFHFQCAGDARAVAWLIRAGDRAHRAWAWGVAIARFASALEMLDASHADPMERGWLLYRLSTLRIFTDAERALTDLDEAARLADEAKDRALAAHVRYKQGNIRFLEGDVRSAIETVEQSLADLRALDETERARLPSLPLETALDESFVVGMLATMLGLTGRYTRVAVLTAQMEAEALPWRALVHRGLAEMHAGLGHPDAALREFAATRDAMLERGDYREAGRCMIDALQHALLVYRTDDRSACREAAAEAERLYALTSSDYFPLHVWRRGLPLLAVEGEWGDADAVAQEVLAGGSRAYRLGTIVVVASIARARGDIALAWSLVRAGMPSGTASEPGDIPWFRSVLAAQAVAARLALDEGNLVLAQEWAACRERWVTWAGDVPGRAEQYLLEAECRRRAGDTIGARAAVRQALETASDPRQPLTLLAAHRLLGELDTDAGRLAEAEVHVRDALALADACAAPYERALTLLALADLRTATGDGDAARTALDDAHAICEPLGARPALARVEALAAHLTVPPTSAPPYPASLSSREVEILRLVAEGLTNPQVAERLFLSRRTVEQHLRSVFTKTGTPSRAAAARWAAEQGLT
jgi:DNA-binding NarL/FixJ family response regulator